MNKIGKIPGLTEPKFCVRPRGLAKTETLNSEWGVSAPRGGQDTGPIRWSKRPLTGDTGQRPEARKGAVHELPGGGVC